MATGGGAATAVEATATSFAAAAAVCYSENFNCADFASEEEMQDVVESFELLHRSIPWLQKADVSSESHRGQLKILQAAIDYIIDLEEQLAEHLSGDLYRAAIQTGRAALERSLTAGRRPFADVNAAGTVTAVVGAAAAPHRVPQLPAEMQQVSPDYQLAAAGLNDDAATGGRQC